MKARDHFLSVKRSRNIVKRQRRASNLLKKVAMDNIASGSVLNLSEKVIPPEVISVLSKGKGFVVNSSFNSLETRTDCQTTLAKLSTTTQFKIKELKEHMKIISCEKHDEKIEDDDLVPDFPKSLKRQKAKVPQDSGDKVVEALKKDIMVDIDSLKPKPQRSNLSKVERQGLKWIIHEINNGDLRVVMADKGGALCIVPKSFIKQLESEKLSDTARYDNLGDQDPTSSVQTTLLDYWRFGEDNHFISRTEAKEVVGLCEKKNGKPQ